MFDYPLYTTAASDYYSYCFRLHIGFVYQHRVPFCLPGICTLVKRSALGEVGATTIMEGLIIGWTPGSRFGVDTYEKIECLEELLEN